MKFWPTRQPAVTALALRETSALLPVRDQALELREAVSFLSTIPEIAEAFTPADLELALDDRGWINLNSAPYSNAGELQKQTRSNMIRRSREYWQRDPLAKQAVRLWTDYALASGMTVKAKDSGVQSKINAFLRDPRNRNVLSKEGQRKSSKKLLIDGDIFFAVFDDGLVRRVEPIQITDIISDPDDEDTIVAYRRLIGGSGTTDKVIYYRYWAASDADVANVEGKQLGPNKEAVKIEEGVVMYHAAFDALRDRGHGLLFSVLDWSREHRRFMEARVALTRALSKIAYKMTVKGGQTTIDAIQQRLQSTIKGSGINGLPERNPPASSASTFAANQGVQLDSMPRATGAGDAKGDGDALKLMFAAGTGIMLHYFGDPSTGNLATAVAMELPMLKQFESYQGFWEDVYRDLFSIWLGEVQTTAGAKAIEPAEIDIDFPPILKDDLAGLASAITALASSFPELKVPEVLQMILVALGINNVDEVMERVLELQKTNQERQDTIDAATSKIVGQAANGKGLTQESVAAVLQSLGELAESMRV